MATIYTIKSGDTLGRIAKRFYESTTFTEALAEFNGIRDPNKIFIAQKIQIPSKSELSGPSITTPSNPLLSTPHGLSEIISVFGNIFDYLTPDGELDRRWETIQLKTFDLPFSVPLSWDHSISVRRMRCAEKLVDVFQEVFEALQDEGLADRIVSFGGCYNFRMKRTANKPSTHCWGISIDINAELNGKGNEHLREVFASFGFEWGGDWPTRWRDPMHFQFCTGY